MNKTRKQHLKSVQTRAVSLWIAGTAVLVFIVNVIVLLVYSPRGAASELDVPSEKEGIRTIASTPPSVAEDALQVALQVYGQEEKQINQFIDALLKNYNNTLNKDFLIYFNPGGWGFKTPPQEVGWGTILQGMQTQITEAGQDSLVVVYRRTSEDIQGYYHELKSIWRGYRQKAEILAAQVQFLTEHNPELKVIITGESMGTLISGEAMDILSDNTRVFSIQTGTPLWQTGSPDSRVLTINNNGLAEDAFNRGDIPAILKSSLKNQSGGISDGSPGEKTLFRFNAPGHYYTWEQTSVSDSIINFLHNTVGMEPVSKSGPETGSYPARPCLRKPISVS